MINEVEKNDSYNEEYIFSSEKIYLIEKTITSDQTSQGVSDLTCIGTTSPLENASLCYTCA